LQAWNARAPSPDGPGQQTIAEDPWGTQGGIAIHVHKIRLMGSMDSENFQGDITILSSAVIQSGLICTVATAITRLSFPIEGSATSS
jgi:hypothetical protein